MFNYSDHKPGTNILLSPVNNGGLDGCKLTELSFGSLSAAVVWKKEANLSGKRRQTDCLSCYPCEEKRDLMLQGMWGSEMFHAPSHSYFYIKICHSQAFVSSHTAAVWWMCFLYPLRTNDPLFLTLWFGEFVYPGVHYSLSSPIVLPLPRREISNICGQFHGICFKCQQKLIFNF